jgi:streptomycin 6-kinase
MSSNLKEMLPIDLVTHVTTMCGTRGEAWFDELPEMISRLECQWSIDVGKPFPGIEYNFVASAVTDDGIPVVLKIAPPFKTTEIHSEAKFLRTLDGERAVRLLKEDRKSKAILMERALPGKCLVDLFAHDPIGSVPPAIEVLKSITTDQPDDITDVPTLDGWFANFRDRFRGTGFPAIEAERAIRMYEQLSTSPGDRRYIHGDFHLGNIVNSDRSPFLVIDPKGIVGHVGYEAAVFLMNLYRWQHQKDGRVRDLLDNAVCLFADGLGLSEAVIRQWGFVHTVIGAWWNYEDMPGLYDAELAMPDIWNV